jgi:predicted dehydrogenase
MVREFKNSVEEGRDPEMSGAAGMLDLEVVIAAYESVQTGNAVTLG